MFLLFLFVLIYVLFATVLFIIERHEKEMMRIRGKHKKSREEFFGKTLHVALERQKNKSKDQCDHKWDYTPKETPQDIFTRKCKVCHVKQEFLDRGKGSCAWG